MKLSGFISVSYFMEHLCIFFRFHTYDYARHFVSACTRILGLEGTPEGVEDQGRLTRVAAVKIKTDVFMSYVVHVLKVCCNLISIPLAILYAHFFVMLIIYELSKTYLPNEWFFSFTWLKSSVSYWDRLWSFQASIGPFSSSKACRWIKTTFCRSKGMKHFSCTYFRTNLKFTIIRN